MIEGAIFDMDGVLLNNLSFHLDAWRRLGRELGKAITDDEIRGVFGQRNQEMLRSLTGLNFEEEEAERHAERKEEIYRNLIKSKLEKAVVPGLRHLLDDLRRYDFGIAVATSGTVANVDLVLDKLKLVDYFDHVLTGDDVENGKPHPDVFQLAARRLGLAARKCVVFEDSLAGVEAAVNARCYCIALSTTHNVLELRDTGAHHILSDFRAISVELLLELWDEWPGKFGN